MVKRLKWDGTDKGREKILARYPGARVQEEQRYTTGTYIIITNEPYVEPVPPRDLGAELDKLVEWARGQGYK